MASDVPDNRSGFADRRELEGPTHHLVKALVAYWEKKRPEGGIPRRDDIVAAEIPALLPNLVILEPVPGGGDWKHRLVGTQLALRYGQDYTGKRLSESYDEPALSTLTRLYDRVAAERKPAFVTGRTRVIDREHIIYEGAALPILGRDGVTVWILIGLFFHN